MSTINELQTAQAEWARRNFGPRPWNDPLMGVSEEVGELNHHLLKQKQGIRGTWEEHEEKAEDSVGDIIVYLMDLCTLRGWDLQQIIEETVAKVTQRDWVADPKLGVVAPEAVQA